MNFWTQRSNPARQDALAQLRGALGEGVVITIQSQEKWYQLVESLKALGFKGSSIKTQSTGTSGADLRYLWEKGDFRPAGTSGLDDPQIEPFLHPYRDNGDYEGSKGQLVGSRTVREFPAKMELDYNVLEALQDIGKGPTLRP